MQNVIDGLTDQTNERTNERKKASSSVVSQTMCVVRYTAMSLRILTVVVHVALTDGVISSPVSRSSDSSNDAVASDHTHRVSVALSLSKRLYGRRAAATPRRWCHLSVGRRSAVAAGGITAVVWRAAARAVASPRRCSGGKLTDRRLSVTAQGRMQLSGKRCDSVGRRVRMSKKRTRTELQTFTCDAMWVAVNKQKYTMTTERLVSLPTGNIHGGRNKCRVCVAENNGH